MSAALNIGGDWWKHCASDANSGYKLHNDMSSRVDESDNNPSRVLGYRPPDWSAALVSPDIQQLLAKLDEVQAMVTAMRVEASPSVDSEMLARRTVEVMTEVVALKQQIVVLQRRAMTGR